MQKTFKAHKGTHSKYYTTLFPDDMMLDVFGHKDPTPSDRANYFKNLWNEWSDNQLVFTKKSGLERIIHNKLDPHMKSLFEWQVRAEMIEDTTFKTKENILVYNTHKSSPNNKMYVKKVLVVRFKSTELCALGKILLS